VRTLTGQLNNAALAVVALLISAHEAFSVTSVGDYPGDAGAAVAALIHGNLHALAQAHPAMGDLSLLLRAPFAALAYIGRPTELSVYRWGVVPCVISVAVLGLWLAGIARARGTGMVGQWAIVLVPRQSAGHLRDRPRPSRGAPDRKSLRRCAGRGLRAPAAA
jgi:hypothetical protein